MLKLNIQKTKIMASSPITSWQRDGEKMETVADFIFLGSKITTDSDCSHEIKRHLILVWKAMKKLDSTLKSRDIPLPKDEHVVKAMVFPVVFYRCELDIKKAEKEKVKVLATQLSPTLRDPMNCSPPGSTVHGILQARILEWVAISFSISSPLRNWNWVSLIVGRLY